MYLLAQNSTVIACPPQRAFDYATDLTHFPQWFPGAIAITSTDGLPPSTVGKQYLEAVAVPLRGTRSVAIRVTEVSSPERFVTQGAMATLLPRMEIEFRDLGTGGCEVSWRMPTLNRRLLPRCTLLPLARRVMQKRAVIGLARLKALLESAPRTD